MRSRDDILREARRDEDRASAAVARIEAELGQLERQATRLRAERARALAASDAATRARQRLEAEIRRTQTDIPRWQV